MAENLLFEFVNIVRNSPMFLLLIAVLVVAVMRDFWLGYKKPSAIINKDKHGDNRRGAGE